MIRCLALDKHSIIESTEKLLNEHILINDILFLNAIKSFQLKLQVMGEIKIALKKEMKTDGNN